MPELRYRRVLVKLSGGAFSGGAAFGVEQHAVEHLAEGILALHRLGVQVAVMVGGGNIFRGRVAEAWSIERIEADNIGMMGTVVNCLFLRASLSSLGVEDVRVMSAIPINAIAEPYVRLRAIKHLDKGLIVILAAGIGQPFVTTDYPAVQRAIEVRSQVLLAAKSGVNGVYSADPAIDPTARRYKTISLGHAVAQGLDVMDQAALILARDQQLPIHVFDAAIADAMVRICQGEDVGTYVSPDAPTVIG